MKTMLIADSDRVKPSERKGKEVPEQVKVSDANYLKQVDPEKTYRCVIQLGPGLRWRGFGGGKWVREGNAELDATHGFKTWRVTCQSAIHETGPIAGNTVNGLIEKHNSWLWANREQNPEGQMNRQLLVLNVNETAEPAVDRPTNQIMQGVNLQRMIEDEVARLMSERNAPKAQQK